MTRKVVALCLAIAFSQPNVIAVAEEPAQTIQALLAEARDAQARRDFSAAAESYRKAVDLEPAIPELWTNLGLMYHELGKPTDAMRSFREAIRLNSSLFVPQLFMGIEFIGAKNPEAATPFLERAEKLNPDDLQAALNLGKAYSLSNHADRAADAYSIASRLAPNDANIWLSLGTAYLQQVESDARLMTSTYKHSAYVALRAAETFAEQGKLVQAEDAYEGAIASGAPAPCTHAEFGITLLRKKRVAEAREQFELENKFGSHCGLAALGLAVAELAESHPDNALAKLTSLSKADAGFVESNLPLFREAVSADQASLLINLARQEDSALTIDLSSLIERVFVSPDTIGAMGSGEEGRPSGKQSSTRMGAEGLYATGQYAECDHLLRPALDEISSDQLQFLASCSFYTGDFKTASKAAERLKINSGTRAQGLYWESKADERLATAALIRAGEIDADSPRMHILLGNVFRQKRRWDDAEAEYRKAATLDPKSHSARLSLAITLFSELKTDEALEIGRGLLAEDPKDPEVNLLVGEILVQRNLFAEAKPYLSKCQNLKPEFVPHLHALLGQVDAETGRIPAAILEYKAGLSADIDGSIHFQLARLYQKTGDKNAADEAFRESRTLRRQWDDRARIALEQSPTDTSKQ
jgi:tetratricopeptide (TPR) repeat protein